jgi:hypothetical protein
MGNGLSKEVRGKHGHSDAESKYRLRLTLQFRIRSVAANPPRSPDE